MPAQKINLVSQVHSIVQHNKDGSYSTQAARKACLVQAAEELKALGFYNLSAKGLKPKHIDALVAHWQQAGKSPGTLKNRMTHLRWLAQKIGKQSIVARDNSHYGIERRTFVTNDSKALALPSSALENIADPHLAASLRLQQAFGLRREECIKFQPDYALNHDKPGYIRLKASWTKGGKARYIPITSDAQRQALAQAQAVAVAGAGSLIPVGLKYVEQMKRYERETARQGLSKLHGLRHQYAQARFRALTGFDAPAVGGPGRKELSPAQQSQDRQARLQISRELGHNREAITAVYLGR